MIVRTQGMHKMGKEFSMAKITGSGKLTGGTSADTITGGSGWDTIDGGTGCDTLTGGDGVDTFIIRSGFDSITDLGRGGNDAVQVSAGAKVNAKLYANWTAQYSANFGNFTSNDGEAEINTNGHSADVHLARGSHGWELSNAGSNVGVRLVGSKFADTLIGGNGNDTLDGGDGADLYKIDGRHGYDSFNDSGKSGHDTIELANGTHTAVTFGLKYIQGIEVIDATSVHDGRRSWIAGSSNDDYWDFSKTQFKGLISINSGDGNDWVMGTNGDDFFKAGNGNDTLNGGAGDDTIDGGTGKNWLLGGDGNDMIYGHGANGETLEGGAGNDKLVAGDKGAIMIGGAGNDALYGGGGDDIFVYNQTGWGRDVIFNFVHAHDKLDVSGLDLTSDHYADIIQTHNGTNGAHTVLSYNGSSITVNNVSTITASDFIFAN